MEIAIGILLVLIAALIYLASVAPREFKLRREIIINRPKDEVFAQLRFLRNHDAWNAWAKLDPNAKRETQGTDGVPGFICSWQSENPEVGVAEQEIKQIIEGHKVLTEIRFKKPFVADFDSYVLTEPVGTAQTRVILGMEDVMPFPMYLVSHLINVCLKQQQKVMDMMDQSLTNLKTLLESPPRK